MVDERVADGRRIAQLLAGEVRGHERGPLGPLGVTDVGSDDGERAYRLVLERACEGTQHVGSVHVHPEGAHLAVHVAPETAASAAGEADLPVRQPAGDPPRTVVAVESGAAVKRATDVLRGVLEGVEDAG